MFSFCSCQNNRFRKNRNHFAAGFTSGMGFLCRVYQDCHHLFDMFHNCQLHFDFANHSNVSLIGLVVLDLMAHRAVPNVMSLRQPNKKSFQ